MLEVERLHVRIAGKPVVEDLSLTVGRHEIVGLIGAPGCGKSTLLNAIFGLVDVASGRILVEGENVVGRTPGVNIRHGIVLVAQGGRVFRTLSVEENLHLAGFPLPEQPGEERIAEIYDFFPRLRERRTQIAGSLSGGERQMLALGMGLIPSPRLLLLDEPSTGLSPLLTERLLGEIKRMVTQFGCSVLLVEQNVKNAIIVSDRVLVIRRGRIGYEQKLQENSDPQPLIDAYAFAKLGHTAPPPTE